MKTRKYLLAFIALYCFTTISAQKWYTHFAYNNVTQIALSATDVYATSDGNLYSVNKKTESITKYDRLSGLHSSGITCIYYDAIGEQLIITYANGKIDILASYGVRYIGDLYSKDMTQRKNIYNVTIHGRIAYLSTHFGIQTMDLRENKLVDSYWLRPDGEETPIQDVLIQGDSIYAFLYKDKDPYKKDSMFCASLKDNLSDYTFWKREKGRRVSPDPNKGKIYVDGNSTWFAGGTEGIVCESSDRRLAYKPDGPLVNIPYRLRCYDRFIGMVPGGYNYNFFNRSGIVMTYKHGMWHNYDASYMNSHLKLNKSLDYCDIAFDPSDPSHFFVASFGYGLMEFRKDTFYCHHTVSNSALEPVIAGALYPYVWVDGLSFDKEGNLWMLNVCSAGIKVLKNDGTWTAISNEACKDLERTQKLLISVKNPNIKYISSIRNGIGIFDDNGTIDEFSDDRATICKEYLDKLGKNFTLSYIRDIFQNSSGMLLLGTERGLFCIDSPEEMLNGNRYCHPIQLDLPDEGRYDIFGEEEEILSIIEDDLLRIWIGTKNSGVYCLTSDLTSILYHFSIENSPMPNNSVLSLTWMDTTKQLYIGTSDGLVSLDVSVLPTEGKSGTNNDDEDLDMGHMQQWRLHYSYRSPSEISVAPKHIYANSNGALLSLNLDDEKFEYWTKSDGLNGSVVRHIAYDEKSKQLIIGYDDGRIDLLADDGTIHQMPDITLKAGSLPVSINGITIGSQYAYLSMPFGVVAINAKKAEVKDTYFIGDDASSINVLQVLEKEDSLYAFTANLMYSASLKDDLANYAFWHKNYLPSGQLQQAILHKDTIYTLQHDSLFQKDGNKWNLVRPENFQWIHTLNDQLLVYTEGKGLFRLSDTHQLETITSNYRLNDGCYVNGVYWLAENNFGLIRINKSGIDYFHPDGPNSNYGYSIKSAHNQIYIASGGRWATQYVRGGRINIYDGLEWRCIDAGNIGSAIGKYAVDLVSIAVDPNDKGHFYVASYGRGVFEFKDYTAVKHYSTYNSSLREAKSNIDPELYTFTDGAYMDNNGNFWVMNATSVGQPLHILTPDGIWHPITLRSNGTNLSFTTPTGIWPDRRNENHKWMLDQRETQGIVLLDDRGTPLKTSDDRCVKRDRFTDQNGNTIQPNTFRTWAQDYSNRIWIGTDKGLLLIPSSVDFFTSNACRRIIIPRNDGTGLGDYLLGEEQINCLAIDGGNRMWIGTENSGLYLIEDDTITVAHFTERNSLLPSNAIQSIAIMPTTGEVFVGTDKGIASYRSDASEPQTNLKQAYAFPNPVRPDYGGVISIAGLMENTTVNIIDASGNLVCKTKSHGGLAVWDGKLVDGRRATPGVYTALCNAEGAHTIVKILVIR